MRLISVSIDSVTGHRTSAITIRKKKKRKKKKSWKKPPEKDVIHLQIDRMTFYVEIKPEADKESSTTHTHTHTHGSLTYVPKNHFRLAGHRIRTKKNHINMLYNIILYIYLYFIININCYEII